MRILLDTHVLVWALTDPGRLPSRHRSEIETDASVVFFSAASMWELAIKTALGRLELSITVEELLEAALAAGLRELPVRSSVALRVASLPMHHSDPFDRLLVAQAMSEPATLLTADTALARYSELVSVFTPR